MNELEKAAREYCDSVKEVTGRGSDPFNAFQVGAEWQSKQSPWITVAGREPDEFKNVLLSAGSCPSVFVGHFNGEDFVVANTGQVVEYFRVLHWMPIPE